jgi:FkbM family methyltransferase
VKQYESDGFVRPEEGDVVIDCGGCWGDTALYFAHEVGASGEVHSFEFISSNLDILRQNLQGNPELGSRVSVSEHPVWDQSGVPMNYLDIGPGSCVNPDSPGAGPTVATIAIDDYVKQAGLKRVDFIKMDIEGAELRALKGAVETLRTFRPKLAIALYHQVSDFARVAAFLDDLDLGYSFRLEHFTPQLWETALFAACR